MREHKINSQNNFIQGYYIDDDKISDDIINLFNNSNSKSAGMVGNGLVNKKVKDSTDLTIFPNEIKFYNVLLNYFEQLQKYLEYYKKKYEYCHTKTDKWSIQDKFNIQKYKPTQGYHSWHFERSGLQTIQRHLVWTTYLNDIKQGGETEFYYQKLKIKPEKGLTLFFPVDWTFTHRGNTTVDEDKYIITGWYDFNK
jgi:hypothetical protein|tara:strand:+ start:3156 stop:3743 length:588 start_codon:yes stop_codon:yes gene_type:complete